MLEGVNQIAVKIFDNDCFEGHCRDYCRRVPEWFRSDPRHLIAFGDLGRMMTVIAALACQTEQGVTLAAITGVVSAMGYASARRIRAICDNFVRMGLTTRGPEHTDHRTRPLLFGRWFEEALLGWLDIMLVAISPWMVWRLRPDRVTLFGLVQLGVARIARDNPFLSWSDVRALLDRLAGYPLLLDLIGSAALQNGHVVPAITRKKSALVYGVSRPHVAGLIAHCEQAGWLHDGGGRLAFQPSGFNRVRLWIATEFAAAKLALEDFSQETNPYQI